MQGSRQLYVFVGSEDDKLDVLRYPRASNADVMHHPLVQKLSDDLARLKNFIRRSGHASWCHSLLRPASDCNCGIQEIMKDER